MPLGSWSLGKTANLRVVTSQGFLEIKFFWLSPQDNYLKCIRNYDRHMRPLSLLWRYGGPVILWLCQQGVWPEYIGDNCVHLGGTVLIFSSKISLFVLLKIGTNIIISWRFYFHVWKCPYFSPKLPLSSCHLSHFSI